MINKIKKLFIKNDNLIIYFIICFGLYWLFSLNYANVKDNYFDKTIMQFLLIALFTVCGIFLFSKKINKKFLIVIILIGITFYVNYPLYNDYLVWAHDINFHLPRIENIKEGLLNLQFPVRIHPLDNNEYGYGTSIMYPELFLYIPAILRILDTSMIFSYKIFVFLISLVSIFAMYYCVKSITKSTTSGLLSAIIYAGANYRLETIFTRAAIGETLALAFFPIVILGLYNVCTGDRKKWYLLVIGISCVIQSHIISIFFLTFLCICFGITYIRNIICEKRFIEIGISLILVILLNIWFIVPFFNTYLNNNIDLVIKDVDWSMYFCNHSVIPAQLFNIFDSGTSYHLSNSIEKDMYDEMNFSLGLICTLGLILTTLYCFKHKDDKNKTSLLIKLLLFMSLTFLIACTTLFPWENLINKSDLIKKICCTLQYPLRLLGIPTLCISITTGIILGNYINVNFDNKKSFYDNYKILIYITIATFICVPMFLGEFSKQYKAITNETSFDYDMSGYSEYFIQNTNLDLLTEENYSSSKRNIYSKLSKKRIRHNFKIPKYYWKWIY